VVCPGFSDFALNGCRSQDDAFDKQNPFPIGIAFSASFGKMVLGML
jgi:hypothetical protein